MSKELADRLEEVSEYLVLTRNIGMSNAAVLNEAIAALRAEPVAWAVTNNGLYVAGNIFRYKPDAQMCMDNLNRMHPQEARTMVPLYAPPSRETDQRESSGIRIEGSQSPGSNPAPDVGQSKTGLTESHSGAPTQAEPALSAEQILAQYDQEIKRGGSTDSIIVRTVQHFTALSSLTARDEVEKMRRRVEMYRDKARGNHEAYLKLYADFVGIEGVSHD